MAKYANHIRALSEMSDPNKIRRLMENARAKAASGDDPEAGQLADAAFHRLISILPSQNPGSVEYDFWKTIHAFEQLLSEERGKTTRLARTRQKIQRVGERQTLSDFAHSKKPTEGFSMLIERGLYELTGEALILKHAADFDAATIYAAKLRLEAAGVDIDTLPTVSSMANKMPA